MEIGEIVWPTGAAYDFDDRDANLREDYRGIQKTESCLMVLEDGFMGTGCLLPLSSTHTIQVQPIMSRPPNNSEASIEAGYDEKRGAFIEGKWTWTWQDKEDGEPRSDAIHK